MSLVHDPVFHEISVHDGLRRSTRDAVSDVLSGGKGEEEASVRQLRRLFHRLIETFATDLPRELRADSDVRGYVSRARDLERQMSMHYSIQVSTLLLIADGLMKSARASVTRSRNPTLKHSAPLSRAARSYGELLRCAGRLKTFHERSDAIKRLGG